MSPIKKPTGSQGVSRSNQTFIGKLGARIVQIITTISGAIRWVASKISNFFFKNRQVQTETQQQDIVSDNEVKLTVITKKSDLEEPEDTLPKDVSLEDLKRAEIEENTEIDHNKPIDQKEENTEADGTFVITKRMLYDGFKFSVIIQGSEIKETRKIKAIYKDKEEEIAFKSGPNDGINVTKNIVYKKIENKYVENSLFEDCKGANERECIDIIKTRMRNRMLSKKLEIQQKHQINRFEEMFLSKSAIEGGYKIDISIGKDKIGSIEKIIVEASNMLTTYSFKKNNLKDIFTVEKQTQEIDNDIFEDEIEDIFADAFEDIPANDSSDN